MATIRLVTLSEWKTLNPFSQGYALYMQEELPGSELKGQPVPYSVNTPEYHKFQEGQSRAMLDVQDGEE